MSTPFNYELDEYRIRQLLLNTEFGYTENDWHAFEAIQVETDKLQKKGHTPSKSVSIGISRNVMIPALFIAGIGLFTLLLMNMIKLKPRAEAVPAEREVKPDPNHFKQNSAPSPAKTNALKNQNTTASKPVSVSTNGGQQTATLVATTGTTLSSDPANTKSINPVTHSPVRTEPSAPTSTVSSMALPLTKTAETKSLTPKPLRKKRSAEVLETIQPPVILGNSEQEEEVELK